MVYVPERGDAVWLDFRPQIGREQSGRRPAIVLSPASYNRKVGLAIFCPITSKIKGYPFEVPIPKEQPISGVVLSDQVKSLDWRVRRAEYIITLPSSVVVDVLSKIEVLLS
ncbi:endoribonuclease MazF [cf. Phormidesmis sp. LEGE 11477]|uniref:endoribonuclease MazF n=1 Tax=cf. Phormidesmis sp. LEGE 11477 TaxID=1828680 RepID=UPI0018823CA1|nr:endoribonuclease MazF [cf. Phormidesmis sp. LEGE 11477]MBE9064739.1 endoribonuclease MazF [cf. Phormidesmis sp. LEGE 11477]